MKTDPIVGYYSEDALRKVAWIIGPQGAAAQALAVAERRRAAGEVVTFYRTRSNCILVGPDLEEWRDLLGEVT